MSLTIWTVIFANQTNAFNYNREQMITYIFLITVLQGFILTSALHGLANDIYSGKISQLLLKPMSIFTYLGMYELSDKLLNISFIAGEMILLYLLFKPVLTFPSLFEGIFFLFWLLGGMLLHFIISILFGTIGFWSPDVWGPKFIFFMIVDFTAGKLFPLDILPEIIQRVVFLTPFPYLSYAQVQLFLGRLSTQEILSHSLGLTFWILLLGFFAKPIWYKGIKSFAAAGQ